MFEMIDGVLKKYVPEGGETEVTVPEGVVRIAEGAFPEAYKVRAVHLPESLKEIDMLAFNGEGISLESIRIPDGVEKIGGSAFMDCTELTSVSLPERLALSPDGGLDCFTFIGGKTLLVILRRDDSSEKKMYVSYGQMGGDTLAPISREACESYDNLLAAGKIKMNRINEEGRLRGIIWRLQDKEWPVKPETVPLLVGFLAEKADKAAAAAVADNDISYIRTMCEFGAVNDDNRAKIQKKLKASKIPGFVEINGHLDELTASSAAEVPTESRSPEEEKCAKWMKDNKGDKLLLSMGIDEIPPVRYRDRDEVAPPVLVRFVIASLLVFPNDDYYKDESLSCLLSGQPFNVYARAIRDTDEIATLLDPESMLDAIRTLYDKADRKRQSQLCAPLFRFADGKTVQAVYGEFKKTWYETAVANSLQFSDTREAMLLAEKCKVLHRYARLRDTTEEDIRDNKLIEFGLDENGRKEYDLGERKILAELQRDLTVQLTDLGTGKIAKSVPQKGSDPEKAKQAAADYAELKKNVKKVVKSRADILFADFLSGKETDALRWKESYCDNPVLRQLARTVVWSQKGKSFILSEKGFINETGKEYLFSGNDPVSVAHPMDLTDKQLLAWRSYFTEKEIKQPFRQVWEPVLDSSGLKPDRYAGCMIPFYRFKDQEKHGITVRDYDYHNDNQIRFDGCKAEVERIDFIKHELDVKDRFEIKEITFTHFSRKVNHIFVYLDQATLTERILKDDEKIRDSLDSLNVAQISDAIRIATENKSVRVTSILLDYKNRVYPDSADSFELTL